ncbi:MAG: AMP-binding protein, partial [Lentisphaeria bacterium]|nr:AMP-binding protein [Lentisphaeria bacterium]
PMVMQGYLNAPERTKAVMTDGYYNTGDIVTMDRSGHVYICGRLSRFSKIAGEMVPHEMVECIINELCGKETRVVAVGSIPDPKKGEALLVLYTPETPYTPDEIVAELRERSISNLWIPKAVNFHPVEKLPLLGSGKLDLSLLRKIADQVAEERNLNPKKG